MPASTPHPIGDIKEYDARTASINVGGSQVEDISSFAWDQSKAHELTYTIDDNAVWVKGTPEMTGSVVMHASSPSVPTLEQLWISEEVFNITAQPAESEARGELNFVGCMATDFNTDSYEIDGMPTVTLEWQGAERGGGGGG